MPSVVPALSVTPDGGDGQASADAEPPIRLYVDVVHEAGEWGALAAIERDVTAAASAVADELDIPVSEACLALSSDADVARLNATYRGKPAPTNVLSFPAHNETAKADAPRFLGDVILARETLLREAAELGVPLEHHMQHLVVHGLLHLLGYDHEADADAHVMEALEARILARLGIPNPYLAAEEPRSSQHITEIGRS
jgi:probable rRNA maturation factor